MSRFPDPAQSRAVLIGVSHFPESPELADLPAVRENVAGLWRRLTDDAAGVLGPGHCEVADPEGSTADIGRAISRAAAEASDMLLIYYAGHGLVDDRGRLYLATNATRADAPKYSALGVDLLREDLGGSGAAARVLILDCCFSGRAIEVMSGEEGLLDGQLSIAGTYTMTSTTANAPSYALAGERYTAFTGALLAALDSPRPLALDEVYRSVAANLQSRGLPRPRQRATDTAGALALARGPAEPDKPPSDPVNEVRFRRDRAAAKAQMKRNTRKPLGFVSVFVVGLPVLFAGLNHDASWLWAIPVWGGFAALIKLITALVDRSLPLAAELVIDRSAIAVHLHRSTASTGTLRIPWRDISYVGVVPPKRGSVNPKLTQVYKGNHLLVVRLRPGVPFSSTKGMTFSDELHELGYRVIATIGSFGAGKEQILAALDQFAGDRVLHSEQEFLARDPRIQPKMF
ncbi:caspase domain-containing protein [Streptomyces sp. NPDC056441]|uniref:caspase family protein n=1 Tax=Streptomyces sp. NPDC056441 TaxID=3345817 RepID=UPI003682636A